MKLWPYILAASFLANSAKWACANPELNEKNSLQRGSNLHFFAVVDNTPLTQELLDLNIKLAVSQGQKNGPELQKNLKDELINREILAQQAERLGLESSSIDAQYMQLHQTLLIQALIDDHFRKAPITEEQLRGEYDRQLKSIGGINAANQYRISKIDLRNESEAIALLNRIHNGESFDLLARTYSLEPLLNPKGAQLEWLNTTQVNPELAQQLNALNKGQIIQQPIKTQNGWIILRLDDKRSMRITSYDQAKPQLRQALIQQYLVELVKDLRGRVRVTQ